MSFKQKKKKAKVSGKTTTKSVPRHFFSVFAKETLVRANKKTRKHAKDLTKEAKSVIREQRYAWEPLTDEYLDKKKKNPELDERILIATKAYVNKGIGTFEKDGFIFVGPKPGIHKPSGMTYRKLARIHEFGTWDGRIPARPLWRPLLSIAVRKSAEFRKIFQAATKKAFDKKVKAATKKKTKKV